MRFVKPPYLMRKWLPARLVWHMPRREKAIYLTFDDGPVPEITPWVLDTLAAYQARATFFCVGDNVRKHPGIYQQVLEAGHAVGNHTFNHLKGPDTGDAAYLENIRKCADLVDSNLFRPPYGRITRSQVRKLQTIAGRQDQPYGSDTHPQSRPGGTGCQLKIIMWDVLSWDFDPGIPPEKCLQNVARYARNGSIVVFHDSLKAAGKLKTVLPRALEYWLGQDYQFRKIPNKPLNI